MKMVKLSVIIPVYNTPQALLQHCLSSVQENVRNLSEVEILCINDGSTDPHVEQMLKQIEKEDSRFKYIFKKNSGVSDTRNSGIDIAQGEYIVFVDSDDFLEPDALQYMLDTIMETDADIAVFGYCDDSISSAKARKIKKMLSEDECYKVLQNILAIRYESIWRDYGINMRVPYMKIYKRSIMLSHNIIFPKPITYAEDALFNFIYVSYARKVYVDNKLVYHYVRNVDSATQKFTNKRMSNTPILLDYWEKIIMGNQLNDKGLWHDISLRALSEIRYDRTQYFTHPQNIKSFWELISELKKYLHQPIIKKWIKEMHLSDASDKLQYKNILLLKLHLYWIFLITERRQRKHKAS